MKTYHHADLWHFMCVLDQHYGAFSLAGLTALTDKKSRRMSESYIEFLRIEGVLGPVSGAAEPSRQAYKIMTSRGDAPPASRPSASIAAPHQRALWTALRTLPDFSAAEISYAASTEDHTVEAAEAHYYCRLLEQAGYLVAGQMRWRLLAGRNTGPKAPIVTPRLYYDLNMMRRVDPAFFEHRLAVKSIKYTLKHYLSGDRRVT
jgi:hypothetical protein